MFNSVSNKVLIECNRKVVIIIPIYIEKPTNNERQSIIQTFNTLEVYTIVFIAPEGLNIEYYKEIVYNCNVIVKFHFFSPTFFRNIEGYNRLMLSADFYLQFVDYEFMLIYQLDAFVFKDELMYWCNLGYDYIGAPWIVKREDRLIIETFAGNGGFSLRRIQSFVDTLKLTKKIVLNPLEIINEYSHNGIIEFVKKTPLIVFRIFGYKNNSKFFIKSNTQKEDIFWAYLGPKINRNFKSIKGLDAIPFAFDRYPTFLYNENNNKLPFGCHAWNKHEPEFWNQFIKNTNS